jgi:hypothetical protein
VRDVAIGHRIFDFAQMLWVCSKHKTAGTVAPLSFRSENAGALYIEFKASM